MSYLFFFQQNQPHINYSYSSIVYWTKSVSFFIIQPILVLSLTASISDRWKHTINMTLQVIDTGYISDEWKHTINMILQDIDTGFISDRWKHIIGMLLHDIYTDFISDRWKKLSLSYYRTRTLALNLLPNFWTLSKL